MLFDQLDKHQLKELLIKNWMTHDGAWFYNCVKELGVNVANKLNKASIKTLAPIEVQRIKKALGMESEKIETFEQLKNLLDKWVISKINSLTKEVNEFLEKERRQASVIILREIRPGYIMPVGVWNVRENVRNALKQKPLKFETLKETLDHVRTRLHIDLDVWIDNSQLLKDALVQKKITDFFAYLNLYIFF